VAGGFTTLNTKYTGVLLNCLLIASCSGGGSPAITNVPNPNGSETSAACEQDFFKTIIGNYRGTVDYAVNDELRCMWELSVNIRGGALGPRCILQAETEGTVTQLVFADEDAFRPYQCFDESGVRRVTETISGTVLPGEEGNLDNSHFPIEIRVENLSMTNTGPYFGDESVRAEWLKLFDAQELIDHVIIEGDGTVTLRDGGINFVNGILAKEN